MSFWSQYKEVNNLGTNYKILSSARYKDIFLLYGEHNLLEKDSEYFISTAALLWKKNKLYKYPKLHVMAFPEDRGERVNIIEEKIRAGIGIMMDDCYRFGCFDLSYNCDKPITLPRTAETDIKINTKRNILLVPYTQSRIHIPLSIWGEIARTLQEAGYTVYTNVGTSKEKAIGGTVPLSIKIAELPAVLKKYEFVSLCGRCGLADWLFVNECKQIIIHSCLKRPRDRNEWVLSSVERKDSFKVMKHKNLLDENNAEDVYFYIDDLPEDYVDIIIQKLRNIDGCR